MKRFSILMKCIAWFLVFSLFCELIPEKLFAGEGPQQPEAAQFEPVDVTDLVNLYSGDFVYALPLLEIPGPEGNWPLSMSYHAGINPNTEATWVGLGWSLNPGAINRFVAGYPDDYMGGLEYFYLNTPKQSGYGMGIQFSYGPGSVGINYDSQTGFGFNLGVGISNEVGIFLSASGKDAEMGIKLGDMKISYGSSGLGIAYDIVSFNFVSPNFASSLGISIEYHSKGNKLSMNSEFTASGKIGNNQISFETGKSGTSASINGWGAGYNSKSNLKGNVHYRSNDYSIFLPVGLLWGDPFSSMTLRYYEWEMWMDANESRGAVGTLYGPINWSRYPDLYDIYASQPLERLTESGIGNVYNDYLVFSDKNLSQTGCISRDQRMFGIVSDRNILNNKEILSAEDIYQVNAQGLCGTFQPFFDHDFCLEDYWYPETERYESYYHVYPDHPDSNIGNHIKFRFLGEQGGNFVTLASYKPHPDITGINGEGNQDGSNKIFPALDEFGSIVGFRIITPDGKIYEFFRPVMQFYSYNRTAYGGTKIVNEMQSPYATSWLLTGIKGPDYIDRGQPGFSADDWGFWIKFRYKDQERFTFWRTPWQGFNGTPEKSNSQSHSMGMKETVYLESIETATHLARFHKENRDDNKPVFSLNDPAMSSNKINLATTRWEITGPKTARFIFNVDKEYLQNIYTDPYLLGTKMTIFCNRKNGTLFNDFTAISDQCTLNMFYNYGNHTAIDLTFSSIDGPFISLDQALGYDNGDIIVYARFEYNFDPNLTVDDFAQKLKKITLHKKTVNSDGTTNYTATYGSLINESVNFDYNYSLSKNSPNSFSTEKGKLTLNKITKKGVGDFNYLPPMVFSYGFNPDYDPDNWDYWNGYTSEGMYTSHFNSKDLETADRDASAYSLKSIFTSLGSTIEVEYESDHLEYVKDLKKPEINPEIPFGVNQGEFSYIYINNSDKLSEINNLFNYGYNNWWIKEIYTYDYPDQIQYYPITIESIVGNKINFTTSINFTQSIYYDYFLTYPIAYAGGHRVKSILVYDGNSSKKIKYNYKGGSTNFLPSEYGSLIGKTSNLLINHGYNVLGPAPSVGYSQIDVMDVDPVTNNSINGKTRFIYITPKDESFYAYKSGIDVAIKDKTSICGQIKNIEIYGLKPNQTGKNDNDYYLSKKNEMIYSTNWDFGYYDGERVVLKKDGTSLDATQQMGVSMHRNMGINIFDNIYSYYEYRNINMYLISTSETIYSYDIANNDYNTPTLMITNQIDNIGFDAMTGNTIYSQTKDSKGNIQVNEKIPAYWFYEEMENKNMLTQGAYNKTYFLTENNFLDLKSNNTVNNYVISADVTTWKNWGNEGAGEQIWRINDKYGPLNLKTNFIDFSNWLIFDEQQTKNIIPGWKRTMNMLQYDKYGHAIEEKHMDGVSTSAMYGYERALPIAIVNNASYGSHVDGWPRGFSYCGFEVKEGPSFEGGWSFSNKYSTEASFTGKASAKITTAGGGNQDGPKLDLSIQSGLQNNKKYLVSVWVKTTSPNFQVIVSKNSTSESITKTITDAIAQVGDWKLIKFEYPYIINWESSDFLSVSTKNNNTIPAYIDDIRVIPHDAILTTYTYNPDTWKLTSITDNNNITTYYEYDEAGRLIRVLDQDKNIIKKNVYQYGRPIE